jgi:hypothetical protein
MALQAMNTGSNPVGVANAIFARSQGEIEIIVVVGNGVVAAGVNPVLAIARVAVQYDVLGVVPQKPSNLPSMPERFACMASGQGEVSWRTTS